MSRGCVTCLYRLFAKRVNLIFENVSLQAAGMQLAWVQADWLQLELVFIILVVYQAALIEMKYLQNEEFYIRLRHNFQLIRLLQECTK